MDPHELSGTYTYRSFINEPKMVDSFGELQFAQAELTLFAGLDGNVTGFLSWPTKADDSERAFMDIEGRMVAREPLLVRLDGIGRKGSAIETFHYRYELTLARHWPETTKPRPCLIGSALRVKDHGTAKAGVTASVIAVRRDFVEPRDIPGVALAPSVVAMLAGKWHRLWHATWHTVRGQWPNFVDEATRTGIAGLGWGVERPPRKKRDDGNQLILDNGAGEDFLFMHRWMIKMVRDDYAAHGLPPPVSWRSVPSPRVAQIVYAPATNPAGVVEFKRDLAASGNMVPVTDAWAKSQEYFNSVMGQWESNYKSVGTLASLSLGALGNLVEFTIHNAMHNRWATPARDPDTGELLVDPVSGAPGSRPTFDFSDRWSSPRYDFLGEFYSSHVNPLFWRLHGWVDDRIDDWFRAQEASSPGRIRRRQLHGVGWFEVNRPFVMVDAPFVGVSLEGNGGHGGHDRHRVHGGGDQQAAEIETMLKVMKLIENDGRERAAPTVAPGEAAPRPSAPPHISMRFEMPDADVQ
jgi:hypothetical protein